MPNRVVHSLESTVHRLPFTVHSPHLDVMASFLEAWCRCPALPIPGTLQWLGWMSQIDWFTAPSSHQTHPGRPRIVPAVSLACCGQFGRKGFVWKARRMFDNDKRLDWDWSLLIPVDLTSLIPGSFCYDPVGRPYDQPARYTEK